MYHKPGSSYYKVFTTSDATGAAVNADSLPTATANKNGTDDGAFVLTVANIDTGRYKITGTIPSGYVAGDIVNVDVTATISTITKKKPVDLFRVESMAQSEATIFSGVVASGASVNTFNVTGLVAGTDYKKARIRVYDTTGGYADVRRIYSYNAGTGNITVEPDLSFTPAAGDTVLIFDPMLFKTDFLMDGNALRSEAGGQVWAYGDTGAAGGSLSKPGTAQTISSNSDITSIKATVEGLQTAPRAAALAPFVFVMRDSGFVPKTGLTVTGQISKDGGAFAPLTNAITEVGLGDYKVALGITATEMTASFVSLNFSAAGAAATKILIKTQE